MVDGLIDTINKPVQQHIMKQDILKIAKVKSEKEFYKLYPTKEAFEKAFPKEFKKAKMGAAMVKKQLTQLTDFSNPPQAQDGVDVPQYQYSGMPLKANLQTPAFMQPFNFNAPAYQQYQPMGLPDSRFEDIASPSVYNISGKSRYYGKTLGEKAKGKNKIDNETLLNTSSKIIQGIGQAKEERENFLKAKQFASASDVVSKAASLRDDKKNKYVRDILVDPNQVSPSYGTGYDVLNAAEDGMQVGGNLTEIQNMYNPGDIYSDMGYEPLDDSNRVKQFADGGGMFANWKQDLTSFGAERAGTLGGGFGSFIGGGGGQSTGASKIGGGIGQLAGTAFGGPLGGVIGGAAGSFIGGIIGGNQEKKMEKMMAQGQSNLTNANFQQLQQGQFNSFMEDGGWVSHNWQPQVITQFGGHNLKDLLRDDPTMDTLRSGGNLKDYSYTPPTAEALETMAMGGQLKTTWGGYAEPISHNPYLPGSGETVMFRGKSHEESDGNGHTGIGVKYGGGGHDSYTDYAEYGTEQADADVEVERGEPATELMDKATGETSMIVYGDMKIPSYGVSELNDPKAKGKKFKNYANDLSKIEKRQSSILEKAINRLDSLNPTTAFDKLEFESLSKVVEGANMQLKGLAAQKELLAGIQNAILDTSKEFGLKSSELAKGKIKQDKDSDMAKFGGKFTQAQVGTEVFDIPLVRDQYGNPVYNQPIYGSSLPQVVVAGKKAPVKSSSAKAAAKKGEKPGRTRLEPFVSIDTPRKLRSAADVEMVPKIDAKVPDYARDMKAPKSVEQAKKDKFTIEDALRQLQPYLIPSDQEPFDYSQVTPEMMALATNQLEPVQAQMFQPLLETPYSVSLQDQLNANQADFNALQRQMGYNPAAASALAAQKYAANSAILGQQFRANQEMQMGAYNRNRGILNDATLKNLSILDNQYQRQSQAKSATKAQAQAALSSIADKIAKHKLENRTLGVYENMYNYRFGPKGRAINVNAPMDWNNLTVADLEALKKAKEIEEKKSGKKESTGKNGSLVKAIKNL